ncbi:BTAD domain-containing putative transcriptional regulator [Streptomyces flaveus]|uniref:AfsR family transcriptional regulator n=1 Tax=Streptomyces flaveus TaxID=66370 RepID=A0A917VUE7_9ACTN|nr:BTAD domain-containing putative transcriptional regulator [Streptomyces flaveus]GGL15071.1 AfsR family transcriptional regulator [Streptomyces flaveus]
MRYKILGVTQAEDDHGTPVPIGGPRLRTLLTALALRPNRATTPDTLIDEVWSDNPPHDAHAALQALIARLRRALGKEAITSEPGGYRLNATPEDVDLFAFERLVRQGTAAMPDAPAEAARTLRQALALWHGPALADLPDRTAAATRTEALHQEAIRARVTADLRLGHAADLVPELRGLTEAHPYDEALHALLIRALRDTGRNADALAAYEKARRALAENLGTDPGPELQALHAQLLTPQPTPREPTPRTERPDRADRTDRTDRTGNIRPRLNSFVGREPELDAIRSELHRARLVTLTGPGGSGKTRLAEEAAAGLPPAWLAELAPLDRPEAVAGAVVSALGLRETVLMTHERAVAQDDPVALLIEYCAPRSELLILDNCEHVIEAAAELAETLLTHCPGLTILATSREPLGVPGESVRPVEPLPPGPAHRLFMERAAAVRPASEADVTHDPEAVDEICRRLDGLPLAIELAAARLRMLTPRQIADRLDDRFRLLTSGSRTVLPRQQTLRAVVDWSWYLLDEPERTVLREVSVFAGGWDLQAAEAVCTGPAADLIGALVDKSLIVATPWEREGSAGMRYRLLETIHEYARERAAEVPELRAGAERRHRAWIRALVEEAEPRLRSADQLPWITRLETDLDNIRAALDRSILAADEEEAAALVLAMGWFWWLRNFRRESLTWTDRALRLGRDLDTYLADPEAEKDHPLHRLRMRLRMLHLFLLADLGMEGLEDERLRAYAARVRDAMAQGGPDAARFPGIAWPLTTYYLGGPEEALPNMDAALANCRTYGGDWEIGVTLMFRTHMAVDTPGGLQGVDEALAELRVIAPRAGDRWMRAQVCSAGGEAAMARGRFEEAKKEYEEALRLAREVGAWAETPFLIARLGEIAYRAGDRAAALTALDEASAVAERHGVPDSVAFVLLMRAQMALDDGEFAQARELCEAARAETTRGTPPPQFIAALNGIDALVTAAESGPRQGLLKLAEALREAVAAYSTKAVLAGLAERAVHVLAEQGDHPRAVRLLAAGSRWRVSHPRALSERLEAERIEAAALADLGPERYEAERATGTTFTTDDVLRELTEAAGR